MLPKFVSTPQTSEFVTPQQETVLKMSATSAVTALGRRSHRKIIILDPELRKLSENCTDRAGAVLLVNDVLDDIKLQKGRGSPQAQSIWDYLLLNVGWEYHNLNVNNDLDAKISVK